MSQSPKHCVHMLIASMVRLTYYVTSVGQSVIPQFINVLNNAKLHAFLLEQRRRKTNDLLKEAR